MWALHMQREGSLRLKVFPFGGAELGLTCCGLQNGGSRIKGNDVLWDDQSAEKLLDQTQGGWQLHSPEGASS